MRGDFKAWLQWRKHDSERADEAELTSQKVSEHSHPDDFTFDADGNPTFKKPADTGDKSVQWMHSVDDATESSESYKLRYAMARKKKLMSGFAP